MYNRDELLVKIAVMFYEEDRTKTDIARELGISRPTVNSLLAEAKEERIVEIRIQHPDKITLDKKRKLSAVFTHTKIHIVSTNGNINNPKEAVGELGARLLEAKLPSVSSIGLGWGTSLRAVIDAFSYNNNPQLSVIPMIGGAGFFDIEIHSNLLAFRLAQKQNCRAEYLSAPAVADSLEDKEAFIRSELVRTILTKAKKVDIAVVGIGNPFTNKNYLDLGYLSNGDLKDLNREGACGDILTTFFDKDMHATESPIANKMIGLSLSDLKNIGCVFAVASDKEKALPTTALLKHEVLDEIVISESLADEIAKINNIEF